MVERRSIESVMYHDMKEISYILKDIVRVEKPFKIINPSVNLTDKLLVKYNIKKNERRTIYLVRIVCKDKNRYLQRYTEEQALSLIQTINREVDKLVDVLSNF